jgi:hypothetical protein
VGLGIGCRVLGVFLGLLSASIWRKESSGVGVGCEWFHLGFYDHYYFLFNNKFIIFNK